MCLITFAWQQHSRAPLLLSANRDEFHARPTAAADFWPESPELLAGRDLEAGGTWLGLTRDGRFAAITNIRDPRAGERQAARSRGDLTREFLAGSSDPGDYLHDVARQVDSFLGFNLLVGDGRSLWYLHGSVDEDSAPRRLTPGVYGLSNAALDVPWPKVRIASAALQQVVDTVHDALPSAATLRACVADRTLAAEHELHGQGLPGAMARALSAQFIVTPAYGTRCSTTLICRSDGSAQFTEQRYGSDGTLQGDDVFELAAAGRDY